MALKILKGFSSIITPPSSEELAPDPEIFPHQVQLSDRIIYRSVPQIDKIELSGPLLNEHFLTPHLSVTAAGGAKAMDADLLELLTAPWEAGHGVAVKNINNGTKRKVRWSFPAGHRERLSFFEVRRIPGEIPEWAFKIITNPRKSGPQGLATIVETIETILPAISVAKLLQAAQVNALDIAIDLIGVAPGDLQYTVPKPGKTMAIRDGDGRLETLYLFGAKAIPKTPPKKSDFRGYGPLRMRIYDRTAHKRNNAKLGPFGNTITTRVEVTKEWRSSKPLLQSIAKLPNPLAAVFVQFTGDFPEISQLDFQKFVAASFGVGKAALGLGWEKSGFEKIKTSTPSPLIFPDLWNEWGSGLAACGLDTWLTAAASGTFLHPVADSADKSPVT